MSAPDSDAELRPVLSSALARRAQQFSDGVFPLVLEALREGRHLGASRFADTILHSVIARLAEAERQYEQLDAGQVEQIEQLYENAEHSPVVEAHFGGLAVVLMDLRDEIRRVRPAPAKKG